MEEKVTILVDSHVHIHDCYDIKRFFQSAVKNFERNHNILGFTKNFAGVLFFTESTGENYFKKLYNDINYYSNLTGLKFERTEEENSLRVNLNSENNLLLIAGEQIITSENLEILALGTTEKLKHKEDLTVSIKMIKDKGAIPVIPWGVGKWFGKRGRAVKNVIRDNKEFFLGDNGGRPIFWARSKLFGEGIKRKIYTLPGSDPLALKNQEKKAGSFGFYFTDRLDLNRPFSNIKKMIYNLDKEPNNYGNLENPIRFFKNQFTLHFKQWVTK